MANTALITGASSGIGRELALVIAEHGHDLVLVARNRAALYTLARDIESQYHVSVTSHTADLAQPGATEKLYAATKDMGISILVNNAGVGLVGDFFHDDPQQTLAMAQLNMISLMQLCQLYGRDFIDHKRGKILNVSSVVSFIPGPNQPVYYASKAFVRSLTRSLAYNVRGSGVTVTALHPGVTRTNFFTAAHASSFSGGASPRSVAELGYRAMMHGDIEATHGFANKLLVNILVRLVPYRLHAPIIDRATDV